MKKYRRKTFTGRPVDFTLKKSSRAFHRITDTKKLEIFFIPNDT